LSFLSSIVLAAYPTCDGFVLNTTFTNTSLSGICYWNGGNLYITWSQGPYAGFTYSVNSYNNPNASVSLSGGGTFNRNSSCTTVVPSQYFPAGDYSLQMKTQGKTVNSSCYIEPYVSYVRLGTLPHSTSTTTVLTTKSTTVYTTSVATTAPTTTVNAVIGPSVPSLILSSDIVNVSSNITITARAYSSSDPVEILVNGSSVSAGVGSTYRSSFPAPGNYLVQAYDVYLRLYSAPLYVQVLTPTTSTSSSSSVVTTKTSTVITFATTSVPPPGPKTTVPASGSFQISSGLIEEIIIAAVMIAALYYYAFRIKRWKPGNRKRTGPPAEPEPISQEGPASPPPS
jgi:hypothetical protein